jgi:CHASE2 domain-containing sensor protein
MGLEFLHRVLRATSVVGILAFAFVAVYYNLNFAWGLLVGCAWGIGNFWALTRIITAVVRPGEVDRRRVLILAAIKFPVLYVAGYFILRSDWFPPISLLVGFTILFVVIVLKAAGRMFLRLDDRTKRNKPLAREPLGTRV